MKKLIAGMFLGAILGGVVGTVASDDIYEMKRRIMKQGKKLAKKYDII